MSSDNNKTSTNKQPVIDNYRKDSNKKDSGGTRNPSTSDAPTLIQTKPPKKD